MSGDHTGLSRREALAAAGVGLAGLAGLAGCASLPDGSSEPDAPAYDPDVLAEIGGEGLPNPPGAFPVAIPDEMVERHRTRARELVESIPEASDVPNGAMASELQCERQDVVERLGEGNQNRSACDRLRSGRWLREEAADVRGAYAAATGEFDPDRIEERRDALRADLYAFLGGWEYRGVDPANALVVHHAIEELLREVNRGVQAWPTVPETPNDAVFRVGEITARLERGRAALDDATGLRRQYLDSLGNTASYRSTITGASIRLGRATQSTRRAVERHLDREEPPFQRNLEETPTRYVFDEARDLVEWQTREVEETRQQDSHASAVLNAGLALAAIESFSAIVDAIEAGEYDVPEDAAAVRKWREEAVAALTTAWRTQPNAVSVELAAPAVDAFERGTRRLQEEDVHHHDVVRSVAAFVYTREYARVVPPATAYLVETLEAS